MALHFYTLVFKEGATFRPCSAIPQARTWLVKPHAELCACACESLCFTAYELLCIQDDDFITAAEGTLAPCPAGWREDRPSCVWFGKEAPLRSPRKVKGRGGERGGSCDGGRTPGRSSLGHA